MVVFHRISQRAGQDLAQPRGQALRRSSTQLGQGGASAQERLLDDVSRVELAAQPRVQMHPREHLEVTAKRLQGLSMIRGHCSIL